MVSQAKLLKSRGVGAMFFPVQQLNINYQNANGVNLVTQVRDQGQYVGNHTWSHLKLTNYGTATIKSQIGKGAGGYKSATSSPGYLRPPYGAYNATVKNIAESMDYHVCTWTLDTKDYAGKTASQICSYVKANAKPGSVVLMHLQTKAYDATNCIVNGLRAKGLSLCRPYKVNGVIARAPIRAPYPLQC
jgi:peptidoglycan/xylan/chitin deacetylase (PgdA/CDA1 family)